MTSFDFMQIGDGSVALLARFEVEGDEQAATADVTDQPRLIAELLETEPPTARP